jgi:hypothetical protein
VKNSPLPNLGPVLCSVLKNYKSSMSISQENSGLQENECNFITTQIFENRNTYDLRNMRYIFTGKGTQGQIMAHFLINLMIIE